MAFDNYDKVPNKYLVLDNTGLPTGADGSLLIYNATTGVWEATLLPFDVRNPSHAQLIDRDANDQHPMSAITGLLDALNNKADSTHIHAISDVTDLQNQLDLLNNKKLGDLSDVILTNLSNLEVITWDPTADGGNGAWINMNASILAGTGDNLGNHIATQDLNMNNYKITNVSPSVNGTDAINQNELYGQRIESHSNVNITSVQDLNILSYDNASHKWINVDISSIVVGDNLGDHNATQILNMNGYEIKNIGTPLSLDSAVPLSLLNSSLQNLKMGDLSDVSVTGLDDGYVVVYNLANQMWEVVDASQIGDNLGNHIATDNLNMADNKIIHLADAVAADEGVNKGQLDSAISNLSNLISALQLNDLEDVDITTVTNDQILIYEASTNRWKNKNIPQGAGDISAAANIGTVGVGFFDAKDTNTLNFRNIYAGSNKIDFSYIQANKAIMADINENYIDHNTLLNYNIDEHRIINDNGTSLVDLFSANKIISLFNDAKNATAPMADKWTNPITLTLGDDLIGSVSFDGSANVTLNAQVVDDSHNHIIDNVDGLQNALDSKLSNVIEDLTPELGGDLDCDLKSIYHVNKISRKIIDKGTLSSNNTIDWNDSAIFKVSFGSGLGIANINFVNPSISGVYKFTLMIYQTDAGWLDINWPSNVKWPDGTVYLSGDNYSVHIITFVYYNNEYFGTSVSNLK